jgi:hypothetical protein
MFIIIRSWCFAHDINSFISSLTDWYQFTSTYDPGGFCSEDIVQSIPASIPRNYRIVYWSIAGLALTLHGHICRTLDLEYIDLAYAREVDSAFHAIWLVAQPYIACMHALFTSGQKQHGFPFRSDYRRTIFLLYDATVSPNTLCYNVLF